MCIYAHKKQFVTRQELSGFGTDYITTVVPLLPRLPILQWKIGPKNEGGLYWSDYLAVASDIWPKIREVAFGGREKKGDYNVKLIFKGRFHYIVYNMCKILTSIAVASSSSEKARRLANMVWQSSHINAIKFPIPSPEWADVGIRDMYSLGFLFS